MVKNAIPGCVFVEVIASLFEQEVACRGGNSIGQNPLTITRKVEMAKGIRKEKVAIYDK